ncbi:MAG: sialate O-acetylesterase, partial [Bacteroidota bacterium]|nr:sialate O-acetylesterase [Bacteroidota bacterium]
IRHFPQHYDKQEHILSTNKLIKEKTEQLHVPFVNIHDLLKDKDGRLEAKYTIDGLHLSADGGGYQKWVAYLKKEGFL